MCDVMIFLAAVCVAIYKVADELQDESVNNAWRKPFLGLSLNFLNKRIGWRKKWRFQSAQESPTGKIRMIPVSEQRQLWYLGIYRSTWAEAFPFSSTLLVWLTDGEHLFQLIKDLFMGAAVGLISGSWIYGLGAFGITWLVGFFKELRK
jgi:hypothetical protein